MPTKLDYLEFLKSHNLDPSAVAPILSASQKKGLHIALLDTFASGDQHLIAKAGEFIELWNKDTNDLIAKLTNEYRSKLDRAGVVIPADIYAGVYPTNDVNGHAVAVGDGYLVFLDNGCFETIEAVFGIFISGQSEAKKLSQLAKVVEDYCVGDKLPRNIAALHREDPKFKLGAAFTNFSEEFVIAHEFGHVACGHFKDAHETQLLGVTSNGSTPRIQEAEADDWAVRNIIRWLRSSSFSNELLREATILGPFIYFGIVHLCESFFDSISRQAAWRSDYPPALERIIRAYLHFGIFDAAVHLDIVRKFLRMVMLCSHEVFTSSESLDLESLNRVAINLPCDLDSALERRLETSMELAGDILHKFMPIVMDERLFQQRPDCRSNLTDYSGKIYWSDIPQVVRARDVFSDIGKKALDQSGAAEGATRSDTPSAVHVGSIAPSALPQVAESSHAGPAFLSATREHELLAGDRKPNEGWYGEVLPRGLRLGDERGLYIWNTGHRLQPELTSELRRWVERTMPVWGAERLFEDAEHSLELEMVYVPRGSYKIGDLDPHDSLNQWMTEVDLDYSLYILRFPVTWAVYKLFCRTTGQIEPAAPSWGIMPEHPVVNVSWTEAEACSYWLGLDLPSEPEWEIAARGADGRVFPWGNESPDADRCIWNQHPIYGGRSTGPVSASPGGYSPFGAAQMAGNVYEWCATWLSSEHTSAPGRYRVVKGGSWAKEAMRCRTFDRFRAPPDFRINELGFRCVLRVGTERAAQLKLKSVTSSPASSPVGTLSKKDIEIFINAVRAHDLATAASMAEKTSGLVNSQGEDGQSALHHLASMAYLEQNVTSAEFLLKLGADPNLCDKDGCTPLHYAVVRPQWFGTKFISLLLSFGANGHATSSNGETPADVAARWAPALGPEVLAILEEFGFRPSE